MRFARPWHHEQTVAATHDAALDVAAAEHQAAAQNHAHTVVELDTEQLRQFSAVFSSPRWLRDLGIAAWLLVGVAALLVGLTWILGLTSTIVDPVLVGLVVATVASPAVSWLHRHRVPRAAGAALVLLVLMALGALIVLLVVGGIKARPPHISHAGNAADKFQSWLKDLGMNSSGASTSTDM